MDKDDIWVLQLMYEHPKNVLSACGFTEVMDDECCFDNTHYTKTLSLFGDEFIFHVSNIAWTPIESFDEPVNIAVMSKGRSSGKLTWHHTDRYDTFSEAVIKNHKSEIALRNAFFSACEISKIVR